MLFDSRTYHRGSPISSIIENKVSHTEGHYVDEIDSQKNKFAIYFQFGNKLGLESYWYDRGKRVEGKKEKNSWSKTKKIIKNFYEMKKIPTPNNINLPLKKIDF